MFRILFFFLSFLKKLRKHNPTSSEAIVFPGFLQESLEKNPNNPVNTVYKLSLIKIRIHSLRDVKNN